MTTSKANPKVDAFIADAKKWQEEFKKLRSILLDSELTEEFKWGGPCYTFSREERSHHQWIKGIVRACVFQRRIAEGCPWRADQAGRAYAVGALVQVRLG